MGNVETANQGIFAGLIVHEFFFVPFSFAYKCIFVLHPKFRFPKFLTILVVVDF